MLWGGSDLFVIGYTVHSTGGSLSFTRDKTDQEVIDAIRGGQQIYAFFDSDNNVTYSCGLAPVDVTIIDTDYVVIQTALSVFDEYASAHTIYSIQERNIVDAQHYSATIVGYASSGYTQI